jgi:hypothetical protein
VYANKFQFKIIKTSIFFFLLINFHPAFAELFQERYVLEDREIKTVGILPFTTEPVKIKNNISDKFFILMKENKSKINISQIETEQNIHLDSILKGEVKEYSSETKDIIFSDFFEYHILEQQIKVGIEIQVFDSKTNDLIWRRKASKYNSQRWIDFYRPRIGNNEVVDSFYLPTQLVVNMRKQYTEKELIDKTISEVIEDLAKNLVKLK